MEVINLVFLRCGETLFPAQTCLFCQCRECCLLLSGLLTFQEWKKKEISTIYVYTSDIYRLWISLTWLWPDNSAYATEHDRVTNGSMDVANSAEAHSLQNKFGYKWGHSPIHFEVIASSFLSVHQLQCWHGKDREEEAKRTECCGRAKLSRVLKDQLYLLNRCIR